MTRSAALCLTSGITTRCERFHIDEEGLSAFVADGTTLTRPLPPRSQPQAEACFSRVVFDFVAHTGLSYSRANAGIQNILAFWAQEFSLDPLALPALPSAGSPLIAHLFPTTPVLLLALPDQHDVIEHWPRAGRSTHERVGRFIARLSRLHGDGAVSNNAKEDRRPMGYSSGGSSRAASPHSGWNSCGSTVCWSPSSAPKASLFLVVVSGGHDTHCAYDDRCSTPAMTDEGEGMYDELPGHIGAMAEDILTSSEALSGEEMIDDPTKSVWPTLAAAAATPPRARR